MGTFIICNIDTCIGCGACQVACQDHNDLPPGVLFRRVTVQRARFVSDSCRHCADPACMAACPAGVYYKAPDGTVLQDVSRCIGCGRCVKACPYGAVTMLDGVARKCDGCYARRQAGLAPACVGACPNGSLRVSGAEACATKRGESI